MIIINEQEMKTHELEIIRKVISLKLRHIGQCCGYRCSCNRDNYTHLIYSSLTVVPFRTSFGRLTVTRRSIDTNTRRNIDNVKDALIIQENANIVMKSLKHTHKKRHPQTQTSESASANTYTLVDVVIFWT